MEKKTRKNSPEMLSRSRSMRHEMTGQELHLWLGFLRERPETVRRQKIFGPYIVDFYIASRKLVIELDGSQHYQEEGKEYDEKRDRYLQERGLTVLRYSNADIDTRFRSVCEDILKYLEPPSSVRGSGQLPLEGEAQRGTPSSVRGSGQLPPEGEAQN